MPRDARERHAHGRSAGVWAGVLVRRKVAGGSGQGGTEGETERTVGMSEPVKDIMAWLATLPADARVGVDDGGLALIVDGSTRDGGPYFEIGGASQYDEDEFTCYACRRDVVPIVDDHERRCPVCGSTDVGGAKRARALVNSLAEVRAFQKRDRAKQKTGRVRSSR